MCRMEASDQEQQAWHELSVSNVHLAPSQTSNAHERGNALKLCPSPLLLNFVAICSCGMTRAPTCPKMSSESPKRSAKGAGSIVVTASSYLGGGTYLLRIELISQLCRSASLQGTTCRSSPNLLHKRVIPDHQWEQNLLRFLHVPVPDPPLDLILLVLEVSPPSRLQESQLWMFSLVDERLGMLP